MLAVIVILAIILVIAVPKVMSVIEDAKKATLESTAKMIASAAEKAKVQNTVLGKDEEITCESVAKINNKDYTNCSIVFKDNKALVTMYGNGKFEGFKVCDGTKEAATIISSGECPLVATTYIEKLLEKEEKLQNGLVKTEATYTNADNEEITLDAGIRYVGEMSDVKNQVYYNCEDIDASGVAYGSDNYDYAGSCEVWRIIGVFDVSNGMTTEKRIKIINTSSTFVASWDSSASDVNDGYGINEWGESTYNDGSFYEGADLMRLLNGYYMGKVGAECKYCNGGNQETCIQTCTAESLKQTKMKPLTNTAKRMIDESVWPTYATDTLYPSISYVQERGIIKKYTGCKRTETIECTVDNVKRDNEWTGLVGLMSVSDMLYANGWLYNKTSDIYLWSISPYADMNRSDNVWRSDDGGIFDSLSCSRNLVFPTVYLKSDIKIIKGDGFEEPYILSI